MVRDPWWLFAYWDMAEGPRGPSAGRTVLRIYDVTGLPDPKHRSFFDIEPGVHADNWYVDVGLPDHEWTAEIGVRANDGRFSAWARSNRVRTPSFGLSDVLDEEWMLPEEVYCRLIGRSLGEPGLGGSMDIRKLLEKYLRHAVSSERVPEFSRKA
jgi:hypothetical protein